MISSDVIRGYNDLFILRILFDGESYGYEIGKKISELTNGQYIIKETTLYSAFTRLSKAQYIESFPGTETNGRKRTYYRLTSSGKDALYDKLKEWSLTKQVVEQIIKGA